MNDVLIAFYGGSSATASLIALQMLMAEKLLNQKFGLKTKSQFVFRQALAIACVVVPVTHIPKFIMKEILLHKMQMKY